ncbi:MAG: carboxylating nicotinate-nucleotide diphosphorylase [Bacteroidales bacterium]|jgi:nicotinate-nucleotide pyrophosphorylase (carboxylating)|nr:carboxylating nicotinate-nucleotide diphosphorylase [Bacteroidales bacterium]
MIDLQYLTEFIDRAFREDIGDGDHTSLSCIPTAQQGKARLLIKEAGILAGVEIAEQIFHRFDKDLKMTTFIHDGSEVKPGDVVFTVEGKVISILQCERLVLNTMQHTSGIATQTNQYVKAIAGTKARLLDTRKTTPGMRLIDKEAVRIGGGVNHRVGLFDMILIKDNHIDFAGGIENAIDRVHEYLDAKGKNLKIEIEARSISDIERILKHNRIDRIMLDNFDTSLTKQAVELIAGRYETESSGNITLKNIRDYAVCGVDFISVGALTHHVKGLDMSLKAV